MLKLDNPAWHALQETHRPFARGDEQLRLYLPDYAPFGAIREESAPDAFRDLYVPANDFIYLIGEMPQLPPGYLLEKQLLCLQMVCPYPVQLDAMEK